MDKITFNIPADVKKEFQLAVIQNNTDMTTVLIDFIKKYSTKTQVQGR